MFENTNIYLLALSGFFAAIPAVIWLFILFSKSETSKKTVILIFLLGCLTPPILLLIQEAWQAFPQFNIAAFIENNVHEQNLEYILIFVLFGAMEEIIKLYVIASVDRHTLLIRKIGDAIRYSLAAALGFAFAENIYYLYQFWGNIGIGELAGMYMFRSIFTACAHMIFSGIFGYHYGIGKFSIDITEQSKWTGNIDLGTRIIAKMFNLPISQAFKQRMILKGLFIAVTIHAIYNFLLQYNYVPPIIIFVVLGYLYLRYLLSRKAGHLILTTDISSKMKSTIAKKDEDVVVELLGMWFNDKRYVDVIHICERLLERDPDNNVIKLFKAQASDKIDDTNVYKKILNSIFKGKEDLDQNNKNLIDKYIAEKDTLSKMRAYPKSSPELPAKPTQQPEVQKQEQPPKDDSFKLNV